MKKPSKREPAGSARKKGRQPGLEEEGIIESPSIAGGVPAGEGGEIESPPGGGGVVVPPEVPSPPSVVDTPFEGTRTGLGTPNDIWIVFDPAKSRGGCPCEKIRFIQTVQIFVDGNAVDPGDLLNGFEPRDSAVLDDDPATPEDETGLHVDRLPGRSEPYYGGNGAGTGHATNGACNGAHTLARMDDAPFLPNSLFSPGGADGASGNDWNAGTIVVKFEACAICEAGQSAGEIMECIKWTYTRTAADVAAGSPGNATIDETTDGPSDSFKKASERWADTYNFDLPWSS